MLPKSTRLRYLWPAPVGIAGVLTGHLLAASFSSAFRSSHFAIECVILGSVLAAIAYTVRLWPGRKGRGISVSWVVNVTFLFLVVIAIAFVARR